MSSLLYSTSVAVSYGVLTGFPTGRSPRVGGAVGCHNWSHDLANAHDCEHFLRMSIFKSIWLDLCASERNPLKWQEFSHLWTGQNHPLWVSIDPLTLSFR